MRSTPVTTAIVGGALMAGSATVDAGPVAGSTNTMPLSAPIGHLQPRTQHFSPRSPAEQVEQQQMSIFDAEQEKLDKQLDRRLNICRGC